jgi:tRNA (guanine-N7-)-methyltransferase
MEIGFGQGEHLAALAQTHPERLYLGCEAFSTGVVHLLDQVVTQDLKNILVFPDDVRLLIPYIPKHSLHQVYILFADPWPKERHHKRRLVTEDFLRIIESLLKPEGRLFLASDHEGYVATMLDVLSHIPNFVWDPGFPFSCGREHRLSQPHEDDPLPPSQWPLTRYEQKALNAGLSCTYMKGHFI